MPNQTQTNNGPFHRNDSNLTRDERNRRQNEVDQEPDEELTIPMADNALPLVLVTLAVADHITVEQAEEVYERMQGANVPNTFADWVRAVKANLTGIGADPTITND